MQISQVLSTVHAINSVEVVENDRGKPHAEQRVKIKLTDSSLFLSRDDAITLSQQLLAAACTSLA